MLTTGFIGETFFGSLPCNLVQQRIAIVNLRLLQVLIPMTLAAQTSLLTDPFFAARIESIRRRWPVAPETEQILDSSSDMQLVTGHLAGDPRAFPELVKRYTRAIY